MEERQEEDFSEEQGQEREDLHRAPKIFVIPDSKIKLLACEGCRLIKSESQWREFNYCENCKRRDLDYKKFTTSKYEGMASFIDMNRSWLRKKCHLSKNIVPGTYAIDML